MPPKRKQEFLGNKRIQKQTTNKKGNLVEINNAKSQEKNNFNDLCLYEDSNDIDVKVKLNIDSNTITKNDNIVNDKAQEDIVPSYINKAQDIVKNVREDLSKIPSLIEYFMSLQIKLKTQK